MIRKYTSLTALVFDVATPALAQDAAIDVGEDGMYSYPELLSVMPEMTEDEFVVLDANGDGCLVRKRLPPPKTPAQPQHPKAKRR
ncbi:hypothetical protein [Cognatiyoonia sp.]|uniref:hypothetical protein n=1 Tax=Cognatiyoonia sp. TaxID=2211652 RepID=UPI003F698917